MEGENKKEDIKNREILERDKKSNKDSVVVVSPDTGEIAQNIYNPNIRKSLEIDEDIKKKEKDERDKKSNKDSEIPELEDNGSKNEEVVKKKDSENKKNNNKQKYNSNIQKYCELEKQNLEKQRENNIINQNNITSLGCSKNNATKKLNSNNDEKLEERNINKDENINNNNSKNNNKNNKSEITSVNNNTSNSISERNSINIKVKADSKHENKKISNRLNYSKSVFYIILFLNIFLPGIGTIIAAIGWGKSSYSSNLKDRTKELIIRGIIQFFTFFIIVGWIQAITDACHYFEIKSY